MLISSKFDRTLDFLNEFSSKICEDKFRIGDHMISSAIWNK